MATLLNLLTAAIKRCWPASTLQRAGPKRRKICKIAMRGRSFGPQFTIALAISFQKSKAAIFWIDSKRFLLIASADHEITVLTRSGLPFASQPSRRDLQSQTTFKPGA